MAPRCSICNHAERDAIDRALLDGSASLRDIAGQFQLSRSALSRHRKEHLAERMVEVAERNVEADVRTAIDVREQLRSINQVTMGILATAQKSGSNLLALQAIDRVQKQIELQARLIDLLSDSPTVNITLSPEWMELRAVILTSLQAHPAARESVATALRLIEGGKGHGRSA